MPGVPSTCRGPVEYDPTNGLIAGRNLIRVSMAREPHQATPLSGGYIGRADDFRSMRVEVEVTVGDPPTPEEQALRAVRREAAREAEARAVGARPAEAQPAGATLVPEAPEEPLEVVADRAPSPSAQRELDLSRPLEVDVEPS
jgi:hypothetical protein